MLEVRNRVVGVAGSGAGSCRGVLKYRIFRKNLQVTLEIKQTARVKRPPTPQGPARTAPRSRPAFSQLACVPLKTSGSSPRQLPEFCLSPVMALHARHCKVEARQATVCKACATRCQGKCKEVARKLLRVPTCCKVVAMGGGCVRV